MMIVLLVLLTAACCAGTNVTTVVYTIDNHPDCLIEGTVAQQAVPADGECHWVGSYGNENELHVRIQSIASDRMRICGYVDDAGLCTADTDMTLGLCNAVRNRECHVLPTLPVYGIAMWTPLDTASGQASTLNPSVVWTIIVTVITRIFSV